MTYCCPWFSFVRSRRIQWVSLYPTGRSCYGKPGARNTRGEAAVALCGGKWCRRWDGSGKMVHQLVLFQNGNQASRNSFMLLLLPFFVVAFFWASPAQFILFFVICTWLTCFHVMHSYAPLFTIHCQHKDVWATIVRPHPPARQPSQLKQFKPNQPSYSKPGLAGFCFIHFYSKAFKRLGHTKLQQKAFIGVLAFRADNLFQPDFVQAQTGDVLEGKSGKRGSLGFEPSSIAGGRCFRLRDLWCLKAELVREEMEKNKNKSRKNST